MSWALSIADANILISTNTKLFCIECDGHITLRQPHLSGFVGTGPFQGVLARGYPRFINAYNVKRQERSQSTPIPTLSSIHVPWLTHRPNLDKGGGTSSWRFWRWTCGLHPHHRVEPNSLLPWASQAINQGPGNISECKKHKTWQCKSTITPPNLSERNLDFTNLEKGSIKGRAQKRPKLLGPLDERVSSQYRFVRLLPKQIKWLHSVV